MQHKSSSGNVCQGGSFVQRPMQLTRCCSQFQCAARCPELYICLIVSLVSFKDLLSRFGIKYVQVRALICDHIEQDVHAMQVLAADSLLKQREELSAALLQQGLKWKHGFAGMSCLH